MSAVFLRLAGMSVTGGLVVLAVILLRAVFRRAPKWLICALWAAAALRLALPFSLQSGASLMPRSEKVEIAGAGEVAVLRTGVLTVNSLVDRALLVSGSSEYAPPEEAAEQGAQAGEIAGEARLTGEAVVKTGSATALEIVSYIWAAGAAGLLLYAALSTLRLKRRLAASLPEGGGIYRCDGIKSPFVFGIIRPRIYLPSSLPDERLAPVLAHERAHIARGDNIRRLLGCVVLAAHWMNPLVWLGFALFCRDIEAACDERVIKDMDREARADESEALLALSAPKGFEFACPAAFGETGVKWRIKNVLNYKKPAFWLIALAAAAGCALAVCCLTDPKPSEPAECYRVLSDGSTLRVFMDSKAEA
ncbi:MAG: hypothetical protein J6P98_05185, partial [Clostridia bacterium]|nr:hypothetical protein [Clostridia bacterium]